MADVPSGARVQHSVLHERRRHPRCRIIDTKIVPVDLGRDRRGLLVDVSMTGVSVQPYGILQPGETSPMKFNLPEDGSRFEATGVVTWSNASGRVGIEFMSVPALAKSTLNSWMQGVNAPTSDLPTEAAPRAAAAYLPSSYSPWINVNDHLKASVSREFDQDIASLDLVSALRLLLDRARKLTSATGAAIALNDGSHMVCRARSGVAPDLGARFHPDSGLSGEAVRTGTAALCSDTANDTRVDWVACERLNIRSVLIQPILDGSVVIGVIEVFSATPNSFGDRDLNHLSRLAELIAAMLDSSLDIKPRHEKPQA